MRKSKVILSQLKRLKRIEEEVSRELESFRVADIDECTKRWKVAELNKLDTELLGQISALEWSLDIQEEAESEEERIFGFVV